MHIKIITINYKLYKHSTVEHSIHECIAVKIQREDTTMTGANAIEWWFPKCILKKYWFCV